jgi:hypothetical protein
MICIANFPDMKLGHEACARDIAAAPLRPRAQVAGIAVPVIDCALPARLFDSWPSCKAGQVRAGRRMLQGQVRNLSVSYCMMIMRRQCNLPRRDTGGAEYCNILEIVLHEPQNAAQPHNGSDHQPSRHAGQHHKVPR